MNKEEWRIYERYLLSSKSGIVAMNWFNEGEVSIITYYDSAVMYHVILDESDRSYGMVGDVFKHHIVEGLF